MVVALPRARAGCHRGRDQDGLSSKRYGEESEPVADTLLSLAMVRYAIGNYDAALELLYRRKRPKPNTVALTERRTREMPMVPGRRGAAARLGLAPCYPFRRTRAWQRDRISSWDSYACEPVELRYLARPR
jgi:hypothetical protein